MAVHKRGCFALGLDKQTNTGLSWLSSFSDRLEGTCHQSGPVFKTLMESVFLLKK